MNKFTNAAIYAASLMAYTAKAGAEVFDYRTNGYEWSTQYSHQCDGHMQSPIDLRSDYQNLKISDDMKIKGFGYEDFKQSSIKWDNTFIGANFESNAEFLIQFPDKTADVFTPVQFHFHAPSEHRIDGKQYDAEMHIVHTYKGTEG